MRVAVGLIGLVLATVATTVSSVAAATSPAALQTAILKAADAQQSVHYTSVQHWPGGKITVVMTGDAGRAVGIQRITFTKSGRSGHVMVVVHDHTAFIRGDAFILKNYMEFSAALARKYAEHWISVPRTSSGYATVSGGVLLASAVSEEKMHSPIHALPVTTVHGTRVVGVQGRYPGPKGQFAVGKLYALAGPNPLPVYSVETFGTRFRVTVSYSRWNEKVTLPNTAGAIPQSKLTSNAPA